MTSSKLSCTSGNAARASSTIHLRSLQEVLLLQSLDHLDAPDIELSPDESARPNILPAMLAMIAFLRMVFITLKLTQRIFPEKKSGESDSREKGKPCKGVDDRGTAVAIAVSLQTGTKQRLSALPLQSARIGRAVLRERRKLCCCVHLANSQMALGFSPSGSISNSELEKTKLSDISVHLLVFK